LGRRAGEEIVRRAGEVNRADRVTWGQGKGRRAGQDKDRMAMAGKVYKCRACRNR
jgi:hypothetical protein